MDRVSIKAVGASGQGINSIGEVIAKALKRSGYCVFGYREYPSLIKGGHASYQVDIDSVPVRSSETKVNILITLNYRGLERNIREVKKGGVIIHDVEGWEFSEDDQKFLKENDIKVIKMPLDGMLKKLKARPILANVLLTAFVWDMLGQKADSLKDLVRKQYEHKGQEVVEKNMQCIDEGFAFNDPEIGRVTVEMPKPDKKWKDHLLITGSKAMGMGAIHGGLRVYVGYPMTPSSPLLSYVASKQKDAKLVMKQAEDEITALQMASGAGLMGTRAMTATSGGGYDLMTETVSLNGMIENPVVINLAQRPGPATGNPTWTAQGDLLMSVGSSHGEFPRCVIAASDAGDSFSLMPEAFNIAEEYQLPVIVLSDKHSAESLYTQCKYDQKKTEIKRGAIVMDKKELDKLKCTDRYDPTVKDGISKRWTPGTKAATYCAQGDEHDSEGNVVESSQNAIEQMEKRMKKMEALENALPDPELFGSKNPEILLVGWGSTKGCVLDVLEDVEGNVGYLHFAYLWPLKTNRFEELAAKAKKVILVEGNFQGQLGMLIRQKCGYEIKDKILKYDGRPFFTNELSKKISELMLS